MFRTISHDFDEREKDPASARTLAILTFECARRDINGGGMLRRWQHSAIGLGSGNRRIGEVTGIVAADMFWMRFCGSAYFFK